MRTLIPLLITLLTSSVHAAEAGPGLRFKSSSAVVSKGEATHAAKRLNAGRSHVVLEFDQAPTEAQVRELSERGIRVLSYLPDTGVLALAPTGARASLAGLRRWRSMRSESKISPLLTGRGGGEEPRPLLVEFHPDTTPGEARSIVLREGFVIRENPDLDRRHVMIEAGVEAARRLGEWDEVAYVFPADREMATGAPVIPCAGALSAGGPVGQYIATVGPGWDGYGQGPARLTYSFDKLSEKLPAEVVREEIERAMAQWSAAVQVTFNPNGNGNGARNINYLFARGNYGGPYPFDGPGRVLAHTFYPAPPNPEPVAGDVHFDDDETWNVGTRIDLFSVAMHEIGHALGLAHSDNPLDVMYPYYRMATELSPGDVRGIQQIYAPASDVEPVLPLSLQIESPVHGTQTSAGWTSMSGTASGGEAPLTVTWSSNWGYAGTAAGVENWTVGTVLLYHGRNVITVTATDARGAQFSAFVVVERVAAPPPSEPGDADPPPAEPDPVPDTPSVPDAPSEPDTPSEPEPQPAPEPPSEPEPEPAPEPPSEPEPEPPAVPSSDTAPPVLRIFQPATTNVSTTRSSLSVSGSASDNVGVARVEWFTSAEARGTASGTTFWRTGEIPLNMGTTMIVINAYDAAGNRAWRSLVVTRR